MKDRKLKLIQRKPKQPMKDKIDTRDEMEDEIKISINIKESKSKR